MQNGKNKPKSFGEEGSEISVQIGLNSMAYVSRETLQKGKEMLKFTVEAAMADRFRVEHGKRSLAYRMGFETMLRRKILGIPLPTMPYKEGTPNADAYFSGEDHAKEYCRAREESGGIEPIYD